ncbi:MAG: hypothetical protein Q9188_007457 [Gyalolechia gomerana]
MQRTRHPSTSQQGLSRQSAVPAYISQSYPSSRSSSLILHHPATTTPWNSPLRSRTHSIRSETIDPYVFHRECKSLFDPPTSRPTSTSSSTANNSSHIDDPPTPKAPLPQPTIIDWTLPSTRRREYKAIEASTKGFRGLWRRYAPRKWQKGRSLGFSEEGDGDGSDGGSVRRYRIDFEDETGDGEEKDGEKDDEKDGDGHGGKEKTIQEHRICGWSCFGKKS